LPGPLHHLLSGKTGSFPNFILGGRHGPQEVYSGNPFAGAEGVTVFPKDAGLAQKKNLFSAQ